MHAVTLTCQAILFDVDGVLVDSGAIVERTWALWAARHAIARSDLARIAHGRRTLETVREVAPHLDAQAEVAWIESAELNDTEGLVALPGAASALQVVPESRRALVTSGGRAFAERRIAAAGLPIPGGRCRRGRRGAREALPGRLSPRGIPARIRSAGVRGDRGHASRHHGGQSFRSNCGRGDVDIRAAQLKDAHVTVTSQEALRISLDATCLRIEVAAERFCLVRWRPDKFTRNDVPKRTQP